MQVKTRAKARAKGIIENHNEILIQAKGRTKNPGRRAMKIKTSLKAGVWVPGNWT